MKFIVFVILMFGTACMVFLSGFVMPTPVALLVLVLAITSDSLTTWLCLRKKGTEGNPVVAFLLRRIGVPGTFAVWLVVWTLIIYFRVLPAPPASQTAIACAYWLIPLNNLWVLRRLSKRNPAPQAIT